MASIFVSYSRQYEDRVRSLVMDLEALGHQVWFDRELTGGQAWWESILSKIRESDIFVFVLAPESLDSPACKLEYTYASKLRKSILPILIADGVSTALLPSALAQIQFVDYSHDDREAFRALSKAFTSLPSSPPLPDTLPKAPPAPISYLGSLREQIESPGSMLFEEQTGLVLRLKHGLRVEKDREHVRTLLRQFRLRDDLYAKVADEIDILLGGPIISPSEQKAPKRKRSHSSQSKTLSESSSPPVGKKPSKPKDAVSASVKKLNPAVKLPTPIRVELLRRETRERAFRIFLPEKSYVLRWYFNYGWTMAGTFFQLSLDQSEIFKGNPLPFNYSFTIKEAGSTYKITVDYRLNDKLFVDVEKFRVLINDHLLYNEGF